MFFKYLVVSLFAPFVLFSQEKNAKPVYIDANYFYGSILRHNKDISHLVKAHPEGFIVGINRRTFGTERWHSAYNFPDYGISFVHQNSNYDILGNNFGVYGHYNFYFLNRNIALRIAQGIAYNTNPFNLETNPKNNAYGSHLLSSTYVMLNYSKPNIFNNFGLQAGIALVHYSNANVKAPNSSTNAFTVNLGVQYQLDAETSLKNTAADTESFAEKVTEPIHFNFVLRGGVNESDYIGLGQQPFLVTSAYFDKRLGFKSSVQIGGDFFISKSLQKEIEYNAASFPEFGVVGDEDHKRAGVFLGHELHINKLSVISQFGYYVYYPYDFEGRTYLRAGLKYYLTKQIFTAITLKSHAAKAEAIEFGLGFRI